MEAFVKQKVERLGVLLEYYALFTMKQYRCDKVSLEILMGIPEIYKLSHSINIM